MNNSQQQQIATLQAQIAQMQTMLANMQLSNAPVQMTRPLVPPPMMFTNRMPAMNPVALNTQPPVGFGGYVEPQQPMFKPTLRTSSTNPSYKKQRTTFIKQGAPFYAQNRVHVATSPKKRRFPSEEDREIAPYVLSDILQEGEEVTFRVIVGKEADGYPKFTTAVASYDGVSLKVTECALCPSLVGMESDKAGAILYQFMNQLFDGGHLTRKFSIAPWKLCFVKRDGQHISLNRLRKEKSMNANAATDSSSA